MSWRIIGIALDNRIDPYSTRRDRSAPHIHGTGGDMGTTIRRVMLATTMVLGLFATQVSTSIARDTSPPIWSGASVTSARTDGQSVVWGGRGPDGKWHVYLENLGSTDVTALATSASGPLAPDIDNQRVIWSEIDPSTNLHVLKGIDLATATSFTVDTGGGDNIEPSISGNWVSWISRTTDPNTQNSSSAIMAVDISTTNASLTLDQATTGYAFYGPIVSGDYIAWVYTSPVSTHTTGWVLKAQRLTDTNATPVAEGGYDTSGPGSYTGWIDAPGFDLHDHTLVYAASFHLYMVDLTSGNKSELPVGTSNGWTPVTSPTFDGHYVFWRDYRYAGSLIDLVSMIPNGGINRSDIMGYDPQTDSVFPVTTDTGTNGAPEARGGALVYHRLLDESAQTYEIHAATLGQVLPTAPEPNPGTTSPGWLYFPETSHYLSHGFKNFWTAGGGLPVFGYPLTGEYSEQGFPAQFTERQRFEYHAEFAGTPYETELGRLGYESAQKQGLLTTAPFQPLPATTTSDASCTFFATTGHRLCGSFKTYWESHGLNLGDPGVSMRESLALFGYPISEEFTDPTSGLTVQYFERARFEYHPDNAAPYQVLLTRLGAEVLSSRGW